MPNALTIQRIAAVAFSPKFLEILEVAELLYSK